MAYTTIKKPSDYFNTVTYTGNTSAGHAITGVGFQPDLTWNKSRANATPHYLFDVIRGATNFIKSDSNSAESQNTDTLTSFDSDGFTLGNATGNNGSGSFASWNWKANGAGVANTDGTISSTVSVNTTSGFSIVKYTGTSANATVGHGLSAVPKMIIVKNLDQTDDWYVYHVSRGATQHIILNSTGTGGSNATLWQNTEPTSSVFSIGTNNVVNTSGENYIAYCFAEKQGYSKFGSYTGNGSTDGTFIYTGFKPAFVMIKNITQAEDWNMGDNKRNITYPSGGNVNNAELKANSAGVEVDRSTRGGGITQYDMLSNGIKLRGSNPETNFSGHSYIYMAFAEEPLVGDNPATAR